MKKYKYFFLIPVLYVLVSCSGTSEDELIGDWERRAVFKECGRSHAAYFVINDRGYVVGGTNGNKLPLNDVHEFNPYSGSRDRKDRTKGSWTQLESLPAEMQARQQAIGFSLNGKGYVGTGYVYNATTKELETTKDFWRFDPADGSWVEIAPLPAKAKVRRAALAFSLQVGGKWYGYTGFGYEDEPGKNYLADLWRYDPENDEWTEVSDYSGTKRHGATVFIVENRAYISTGSNSSNVTDFYVFNPNATNEEDIWIELRKMSNSNPDEDYDDDYGSLQRSFGVGYSVMTGSQIRGHIVGGASGGTAWTNWEYNHEPKDMGGDLWEQRTPFYNNYNKSNREGMISFSFSDGRAYVGLGRSGTAYYDDLWEFFPLEDDYIYNDAQ